MCIYIPAFALASAAIKAKTNPQIFRQFMLLNSDYRMNPEIALQCAFIG